jgi:hypothetical protein
MTAVLSRLDLRFFLGLAAVAANAGTLRTESPAAGFEMAAIAAER